MESVGARPHGPHPTPKAIAALPHWPPPSPQGGGNRFSLPRPVAGLAIEKERTSSRGGKTGGRPVAHLFVFVRPSGRPSGVCPECSLEGEPPALTPEVPFVEPFPAPGSPQSTAKTRPPMDPGLSRAVRTTQPRHRAAPRHRPLPGMVGGHPFPAQLLTGMIGEVVGAGIAAAVGSRQSAVGPRGWVETAARFVHAGRAGAHPPHHVIPAKEAKRPRAGTHSGTLTNRTGVRAILHADMPHDSGMGPGYGPLAALAHRSGMTLEG
jgi:hypothetical protein